MFHVSSDSYLLWEFSHSDSFLHTSKIYMVVTVYTSTFLCFCWKVFFNFVQTLDSSQQTAHVGDIRQAVRFAVSDLKGQELLPGFCLPKVNSSSNCTNSSRLMSTAVFLMYVLYCGPFIWSDTEDTTPFAYLSQLGMCDPKEKCQRDYRIEENGHRGNQGRT